jgi:nucleoside 2-deoxyribosyltransferase
VIGPGVIAYFAGSFYRKPELLNYAHQFEAYGNFCTSRWLKTDHEVDFQDDRDNLTFGGYGYTFAQEDVDDIVRAELLVFFSSANHASKGRGGRHTEFGIALALEKPIIIIGDRECAFHSMTSNNWAYNDWDHFEGDGDNLNVLIDAARLIRRPSQFNG